MADSERLRSVDVARGIVMVLMAIDHVRVYSGVPAGGPTLGIFFTRWVTHFCAPAFAFFAGTSAYFYGQRLGNRQALAQWLVTRGLILVALELTVVRFSWTFNFNYAQFTLAGVIWMLGWCMVLMAGLVWLRPAIVGWIGLGLIFFQQVFNYLPAGWLSQFIYLGGKVPAGDDVPGLTILYVIVPWIGVMAAGYGFGEILGKPAAERDRLCLRIGLSATGLFLVAAGLMVFMRPAGDDAPPAIIRMLNQQKYPASQLFLLMTLGPTIAFLPYAQRWRGWIGGVMETFGRVPMFYYLLHIPAIHVAALITWLIRDGAMKAGRFATAPFVGMPPEERWSLPLLYLVFVIVVALLYVPCRWYAARKASRPAPWMRYI